MKLTRIDIHGFKSFYRKTVILFDHGITGIVGPNGCGKSNIVDAIKWVMGEQGARSLRGTAMEDVIFSGTKQRGPLGFCEVKLTFEGAENLPPSSRYPHGPTLCVERRLERGKGSDYFLNRKRCRLSDIQEILAGTGVGVGQGGRRPYAIIEQGQIDQVVSAKADERRFLIEEAAGVTRYRQRRRLAERKLAQTDQNLQRVQDIVEEVERQIRSLRRQAKKAERYRDYRAEATRIGLKQCAVDLTKLEAGIQTAEHHLETAVEQTDELKIRLETELTSGAALSISQKDAAEKLARAKDTLGQREEDAKLTRERLAGFAREQGIVLEQVERAKTDLESGRSQLSLLASERAGVAEAVAELTTQINEEKSALEDAVQEEKLASEAYLGARSEVEACFRRESQQKHNVTVQAYRIKTAEERLRDADTRLARLGEQADLAPRLEACRTELTTVERDFEAAERRVKRLEVQREQSYQWTRAFSHRADKITQAFSECQAELTRTETRWQSLTALQNGAEMLGKGVERLLGQPGMRGALIDGFRFEPGYQRAGIAALDSAAEAVIAETLDHALTQAKRAADDGLSVSIILDEVPWPSDSSQVHASAKIFQCGDGHLNERLLAGIGVIDGLDQAPTRFASNPGLHTLVTPEGHSLQRNGVLRTWGTSAIDEILGRRAEIEELRRQADTLSSEVANLDADRVRMTEALEFTTNANQQLAQSYSQSRLVLSELKAQQRQASGELERIEAYANRLSREQAELSEMRTESMRELELGREALGEAERNLSDFSVEIERATEQRRIAEEAKNRTSMSAQSRRARVAGLAERLTSLEATLSRLSRQEKEVTVRRERFDAMSQESKARLASLRERVSKDEKHLNALEAEALEWAGKTSQLAAEHRKIADALANHQRTVGALRSSLDDAREIRNKASLQVESATLRVEALSDRIADRYKLTLGELKSQYSGDVGISDEERVRLSELENLLEKLGEVNLSAIEEYEKTNERYEFLVEQQQDLVQAVSDLNEAMKKIDETSKVLFKEAFERINELFQELFPRLFKGGEGRLSLTNPADLLTTGIEIHCQPPGKRLQSVDLLSGGEKAMCALALIFAVFRYRPSPFCILDEVDAPLDDVNIGRFNEVVRVLSGSSQVVLVTHNKRTMEIADSLYGVTMEESGVSKLVGVQMA